MLLLRELAVLITIAVAPVVAIGSIQSVASVEPLVAAVLSAIAVVLPSLGALLLVAARERDSSAIKALVRPLLHFVKWAGKTWLRTALVMFVFLLAAGAFWEAGAGSLSRFAVSCYGPTSVRWTLFGQERTKSCTDAEILTVWTPRWVNEDELQLLCSGGGVTLAAYPPSARRTEWLCPTNRCPSDMVYVPPGYRPDVGMVRPFCLERTEVAVGDFATCADCISPEAGEQGLSSDWPGSKPNERAVRAPFCTRANFQGPYPINCVDFPTAGRFCVARARRLPSAVEWFWAASGADADGAPFPYPWGGEPGIDPIRPDTTRVCYRQKGGSCPVGARPLGASKHGITDLLNNVWEWTSTTANRQGRLAAIVVGGGWNDSDFPKTFTVSAPFNDPRTGKLTQGSYWAEPSIRSIILGFRCAAEPRGWAPAKAD